MHAIQRAKTIVLTALLCFSCLSPPVRAAQTASEAVILAFGDSLTAGYGLPRAQAWTTLLQQKIQADRLPYRVVNAGISGDTTAGGLARLGQALTRNKPKIVILELGANDGLQGLPLTQSKANLAKMIAMSQAAGARVLLVGMMIPPNYGPAYTTQFRAIYPALAKQYRVPLVPFMLTGVAGIQSLNLGDGIHPNAQGQRIVEKNIWASLKPMLQSSKTATGRESRLAGGVESGLALPTARILPSHTEFRAGYGGNTPSTKAFPQEEYGSNAANPPSMATPFPPPWASMKDISEDGPGPRRRGRYSQLMRGALRSGALTQDVRIDP